MKVRIWLSVLLFTLPVVFYRAQQVVRIENDSRNISAQFEAIRNNAKAGSRFWIGYKIIRNDGRKLQIGTYIIDDDKNLFTLRNMIDGSQKFKNYALSSKKKNHFGRSVRIENSFAIGDKKVDNETAILFLYDLGSKSKYDFSEVTISNLSCFVDLEGDQLFWLGEKDNKNSSDFLFELYNNTNDISLKKEIVPSISIHNDQLKVTQFLINIINGKTDNELMQDAVFWLGFQNNNEAFTALKKLVESNSTLEIKKNAVMSLSMIELPESIDELIYIAKHYNESDMRKQAIYGLGSKAIKKAEDALKYIVENDPDIEIKKHAVYTLANSSHEIIPYLIKIARTNPNISIRKSAIWSLGNMDDEKATDTLISMVKGK